jgi:hypothetical protein
MPRVTAMSLRPLFVVLVVLTLALAGCPRSEEPEVDAGHDVGVDTDQPDADEPTLTGPALTYPGEGLFGLATRVDLVWQLFGEAERYDIDVASDEGFTNLVVNERGYRGLDYPLVGLAAGETYFWRVRANDGDRSDWSEVRRFTTWREAPRRDVYYQLIVRHFGNTTGANIPDGTLEQNGTGRFADIDDVALSRIRAMGVTHIYLTGVLQQATLTDYSDIGEPADDPDILKGIAGSFFAVRDYFDVSPDYAVDPERRR